MDASHSTITDEPSKSTLPTASQTSYKSPFAAPLLEEVEDETNDEIISVNSSLATNNDLLEENCIQIVGTPHESTSRRLSSTRWNRMQTPTDNGVFDRLYRHAVYKRELDRLTGEWKEEEYPNRTTGSDWKTVIDLETSVSHRLEHAKAVFAPPPLQRTISRPTRSRIQQLVTPRRSPNTRYQQHSAAICIQTWWRSRSKVILDYSFATAHSMGQSYLTANSESSFAYEKEKEKMVQIQSWWRMKVIQHDYQVLQWAVIRIQTHYRGYEARQNWGWLRASVIVIQSVIRMFLIRCKIADYYQLLQQRSLLVQYKRVLLQRNRLVQKRAVLRSRRTASVLIQTQWRRYQAMAILEGLKACCIILQSFMRGYLVRKALQMNKQTSQIRHAAAISIQAQWRRCVAVEKYNLLRQVVLHNQQVGSVLIQAQWRRYLAVRMYDLVLQMRQQSQQRAAVVLQAKWRGFIALRQYDIIQQLHAHNRETAAVAIQSQWRRFLCTRVYRMVRLFKLQSQQRAAVKIQAQWRLFLGVRLFDIMKQVKIQHRHRAATLIQAQWRRYTAIQVLTWMKLHKKQMAAVIIQASWRRYLAIEMFECLKACIIIIQSQIRGHLVRKSIPRMLLVQPAFRHYETVLTAGFDRAFLASTEIQRVVRGYFKRQKVNKFRAWLSAAVVIQTKWRRFSAMKSFQQWRSSAVLIQSYLRRYMAQRLLAKAPPGFANFQGVLVAGFERSNTACTLIQRVARGYLVRHNFDLLQAGALQRIFLRYDIIMSFPETYRWQCYWRIIFARHQFSLEDIEYYALRLQSWWRMVPILHHLQNLRILSVWLQAIIRGYICRKAINRMRIGATLIQASFRRWQSTRDFTSLLWAAGIIQQWWRRHRSATSIQSVFRMWMQSPKRERRKESVVLIQKVFRQMLAKTILADSRAAALRIQSVYRGYKLRHSFDSFKNAATKIQTGLRGWLALQHYHLLRVALIIIQSCARGWLTRCRYKRCLREKEINSAAIMIQCSVRCWSSRRLYTTMQTSITLLQSHVRAWLIRDYYICIKYELSQTITLIQACVRRWLAMRKYKILQTSAVFLQSWVRGSVARHKFQKFLHGIQQKRVTKMQAVARTCLAVREASKRRAAIICIQSCARAVIARQAYLRAEDSLVKLQSCFRGWIAREKYNDVLTGMSLKHTGASLIQNAWRKFHRTAKYQHVISATVQTTEKPFIWFPHVRVVTFLEQTAAATTIQSWVRRCRLQIPYKTFLRTLVRVQNKFRETFGCRTKSVVFLQRVIRGIICRRKTTTLRKNGEDRILKSVLQVQTLFRSCFRCHVFLEDDAVAVDLQQAVRRFVERRQSFRCEMLSSIITKPYVDWKLDANCFVFESAVILLRLRIQGDTPHIPALVCLRQIRERLCLIRLTTNTIVESKHDVLPANRSMRLTWAFSLAESSCCIMIQRLFRGYQARLECEALRIASRVVVERQHSRSANLSVRVLEQLSYQRVRVELLVDMHFVERQNAARVIQAAFLTWREQRRRTCFSVLQGLTKVKIYRNVNGETPDLLQPCATPYLSIERVRQAHLDFQMPDVTVRAKSCRKENRLRVQLMDTMLAAVPFIAPLN